MTCRLPLNAVLLPNHSRQNDQKFNPPSFRTFFGGCWLGFGGGHWSYISQVCENAAICQVDNPGFSLGRSRAGRLQVLVESELGRAGQLGTGESAFEVAGDRGGATTSRFSTKFKGARIHS